MDNHRRTLRLGSISGVGIFVHYSWLFISGLILLGFIGQLEATHPDLAALDSLSISVLGTVLFFLSVLVHELAHALMALHREIEVKGITLYLFGGATEADASSKSAADEFAVAIVGPLTSLAAAAVLAIAAVGIGDWAEAVADLFWYLATINVILAAFNLAPGLPLDGGRVFRSIVWRISGDYAKATKLATAGGVFIGYALVSVGLVALWQGNIGGLWLAAIGWLITQSARQGGVQEGFRTAFDGLVAADLMSAPVIAIPADTSIALVVRDYFAVHDPTSFPVVDGDRILGLLSVSTVRAISETDRWKMTAGDAAVLGAPAIIANRRTPMIEVIAALSADTGTKARALVVEDDKIVGIISPSDVMRRYEMADLLGPALTASMGR